MANVTNSHVRRHELRQAMSPKRKSNDGQGPKTTAKAAKTKGSGPDALILPKGTLELPHLKFYESWAATLG